MLITIIFPNFRSSENAIAEQMRLKESLATDVEGATARIKEINSELSSIVEQLGEAKVDKHESARHVKKTELIENLKRLFNGVVSLLNIVIRLGNHIRIISFGSCQTNHKRLLLVNFSCKSIKLTNHQQGCSSTSLILATCYILILLKTP